MENETKRYVGRVKWFNNKSGYGFITMIGEEQKDIFVHWSAIKVENSQYKYLVQGEYVEFELVRLENNTHEFHAVSVSGIQGGNLMCETIRETREAFNLARAKDKEATSTSTPTPSTETKSTPKPKSKRLRPRPQSQQPK